MSQVRVPAHGDQREASSSNAVVHFEKDVLAVCMSEARSYRYSSIDSAKWKRLAGSHELTLEWTPGGTLGSSQGIPSKPIRMVLVESELKRLARHHALGQLRGLSPLPVACPTTNSPAAGAADNKENDRASNSAALHVRFSHPASHTTRLTP